MRLLTPTQVLLLLLIPVTAQQCKWLEDPTATCTQDLLPNIQPRIQSVLVVSTSAEDYGLGPVVYSLAAHDIKWTRVDIFAAATGTTIAGGVPPLEDDAGRPLYSAIVLVGSFKRLSGATVVDGLGSTQRARINAYLAKHHIRMVRYALGTPDAADGTTDLKATTLSNYTVVDTSMRQAAGLNLTQYRVPETSFVAAVKFTAGSRSKSVVDAIFPDGIYRSAVYYTTLASGAQILTSLSSFFDDSEANAMIGRIWVPWVTRGTYVGFRRMIFSTQIDDVFLSTATFDPDTWENTTPFRMSPADYQYHVYFMQQLNRGLPAGSNFTIELVFNGFGVIANGGVNEDSSFLAAVALRNDYTWVSHTYTHLSLATIDQATILCDNSCPTCVVGEPTPTSLASCEVAKNQQFADVFFGANCGTNLAVGHHEASQCSVFSVYSLVTPRISGLFNGLALAGIAENRIRYVVGDNSCPGPGVGACQGRLVPPQPFDAFYTTRDTNGFDGLLVVPRYALDIFFDVALPEHLVAEFLSNGVNITTRTAIKNAASLAYQSLIAFHHDMYMFHQANLVTVKRELFKDERRYRASDRLTSASVDALKTHTSIMAEFIQTTVNMVQQFNSLPILTLKQDYLASMYLQRYQRQSCDYNVTFFQHNVTLEVVGAKLTSRLPCVVGITGFEAVPIPGVVTVERYGPDITSWVTLPGGTNTTYLVRADPMQAQDCVILNPAGFVNGTTVTYSITCERHHLMGVLLPVPSVRFAVSIAGISWSKGQVIATDSRGSYNVTVQLLQPATASIAIKIKGAHIMGSPVTFSPPFGAKTLCASGSAAITDGGQQCLCTFAGPSGSVTCLEDCSATTKASGCCKCGCPATRFGWDCAQTCPTSDGLPCSGHGTCNADYGLCFCDAGYGGNACNAITTSCPGRPQLCSGHGTCNSATGTCACSTGYYGADCSKYCNFLDTCSGHGLCSSSGKCNCLTGWSGASCDTGSCGPASSCSGHGDCLDLKCHCNPNYYGTICEFPCPGMNGTHSCSGHGGCGPGAWGTCCADSGTCICDAGWWDSACSSACPAPVDALPQIPPRIGARILLVVVHPAVPEDLSAADTAQATLRQAGAAWTQVNLPEIESRAFALYDTDGLPLFGGVITTAPTSDSQAPILIAYEQLNRVRRVVLRATPGSAGVPAVKPVTQLPTTGRAALHVPSSASIDIGLKIPNNASLMLPLEGLVPGLVIDASLCSRTASAARISVGNVSVDLGAVTQLADGRVIAFVFANSDTLGAPISFASRVWLEWVTYGMRIGVAPVVHLAIAVHDYCCSNASSLIPAVPPAQFVQGLAHTLVSAKSFSPAVGTGMVKATVALPAAYETAWKLQMQTFLQDEVSWVSSVPRPCQGITTVALGPNCTADQVSCHGCAIPHGNRRLFGTAAGVDMTGHSLRIAAPENATVQAASAAYAAMLGAHVLAEFHPSMIVQRDPKSGLPYLALWVQEVSQQLQGMLPAVFWISPDDLVQLEHEILLQSQCAAQVRAQWVATATSTSRSIYGLKLSNDGTTSCTLAVRGVSIMAIPETADIRSERYSTAPLDVVAWIPVAPQATRLTPIQLSALASAAVVHVPSGDTLVGIETQIIVQLQHPLGYTLEDKSATIAVYVRCTSFAVGFMGDIAGRLPAPECLKFPDVTHVGNGLYIAPYTPTMPVVHEVFVFVNENPVPGMPLRFSVLAGWWSALALLWAVVAALVALGWILQSWILAPVLIWYRAHRLRRDKLRRRESALHSTMASSPPADEATAQSPLAIPRTTSTRRQSVQPTDQLRAAAQDAVDAVAAELIEDLTTGDEITPLAISRCSIQANQVKSFALVDSEMLFSAYLDRKFCADNPLVIVRNIHADFMLTDVFAAQNAPLVHQQMVRPQAVIGEVDLAAAGTLSAIRNTIRLRTKQGFDGVMLAGVDEVDSHLILAVLTPELMDSCLVFIADAAGFVWTNPSVVGSIHGVLIRNPVGIAEQTTHEDLTATSHRAMCAILERALKVRTDLLVMAVEHVDDLDAVIPSSMAVFVHGFWCPGITPLMSLCVDRWIDIPDVSQPLITRQSVAPAVHRDVSPLSLMDAVLIGSFLNQCAAHTKYDANSPAPDSSEVAAKMYTQLLAEDDTIKRWFGAAWHQQPEALLGAMRELLMAEIPLADPCERLDHRSFWTSVLANSANLADSAPGVLLTQYSSHADAIDLALHVFQDSEVESDADSFSDAKIDDRPVRTSTPAIASAAAQFLDGSLASEASAFLTPDLVDGIVEDNPVIDIPDMGNFAVDEGLEDGAAGPSAMQPYAMPELHSAGTHQLQQYLGCMFPLSDIPTLLSTLAHLRHSGVLLDLGAHSEREVFNGSTDRNPVEEGPDDRFTLMLEQVCTVESRSTHPVLEMLDTRDRTVVVNTLRKLRQELSLPYQLCSIKVWYTDPVALQVGPNRCWAAWEFVQNVQHIYVSRAHPNIAEAVWFCFLTRHGFSRRHASLLEVMMARHPKAHAVSDRMQAELEHASVTALATLVHRTRYMRALNAKSTDPAGLRRALDKLTDVISTTAKDMLLADAPPPGSFTDERPVALPQSLLLQRLVRRATWHDASRQQLLGVTQLVLEISRRMGMISASVHTLRAVIYDNIRPAAFVDMHLRVQKLMPLPVRDADSITVYCETLGYTDGNLQLIFGIDKHQFGSMLYRSVRHRMHRENPKTEAFANTVVYTGRLTEAEYNSRSRIANIYAHGFFYSWPAILDILFALSTGHGMFASKNMPISTISMSGAALMGAFIVAGAVNASIGSSASYFTHQWASNMVSTIILERLTAGIILTVFVAVVGGCIAWWAQGFLNALLFVQYTMAYSVFLMLLSALMSQETGSNWAKKGGRAVFVSSLLLIVPPALMWSNVDVPVTGIYVATLWTVIILLASQLSRVAEFMSTRFDNLQVPNEDAILKWHFGATGSPPNVNRMQLISQAREAFMKATAEALRRTSIWYRLGEWWRVLSRWWRRCRHRHGSALAFAADVAGTDMCKLRANQFKFEQDLLKWYCLTRALPMPLPWSAEWDNVLIAARTAMWMQAHSMRAVRGSLLWGQESVQVAFGAAYFALILVDRLCRMIVGRGVFMFQPTIDNYSLAVGWATLFVILTTAWFEVTLATPPLATADEECRLSGSDKQAIERMFEHTISVRWKFYKRQLLGLVRVLFISIGIAQTIMLVTAWGMDAEVWYVFFLAMLGYSGMIMGLFNSMFAQRKVDTVYAMLISLVAGLIVGITIMLITPWNGASVIALTIAGCSFAVLAFQVAWQDKQKLDGSDIPVPQLTPALQTSGQRWIGIPDARKQEFKLLEATRGFQLISLPPELCKYVVPGTTAVPQRVAHLLVSSSQRYVRMRSENPHHLLCLAFQDAGSTLLQRVLQLWEHGDVVVRLVPQQCLATADSMQGYAALAVVRPAPKGDRERSTRLEIIVAIDWALRDDPEYAAPAVAEALVHEISEVVFGYSHADAVLAEMLVVDSSIATSLPVRVLRQLSQANVGQLLEIAANTDAFVVGRLLLQLDVDRQWPMFPLTLRKLLLSLVEGAKIFPGLTDVSGTPQVGPGSCGAVEMLGRHALSTASNLTSFIPTLQKSPIAKSPIGAPNVRFQDAEPRGALQAVVARAHLASMMAYQIRERIRDAIRHRDEACRAPDPIIPTLTTDVKWTFGSCMHDQLATFIARERATVAQQVQGWAGDDQGTTPVVRDTQDFNSLDLAHQIKALIRIAYLALTGSTYFGREAYFVLNAVHLPKLVVKGIRLALVAGHLVARRLLWWALRRCLWRPHTAMGALLKALKGADRTIYRQNSVRRVPCRKAWCCWAWRSNIVAVERHKPYGDVTAFVDAASANADEGPLLLRWYNGSIQGEFPAMKEPPTRKGVQRLCTYTTAPEVQIATLYSPRASTKVSRRPELLRLASGKLYKPDGSVLRTIGYVYPAEPGPGGFVPLERREYDGDVDVSELTQSTAVEVDVAAMVPGGSSHRTAAPSGSGRSNGSGDLLLGALSPVLAVATALGQLEPIREVDERPGTAATVDSVVQQAWNADNPMDHYVRRCLYSPFGNIVFEEFSATPSDGGLSEMIHAHYKYVNERGHSTMVEAMYVAKDWTIVVRRWVQDAKGVVVRTPQPVAVLSMAHEDQRVLLTLLQYPHPRHPVLTSAQVPLATFHALSRTFLNSTTSEQEWAAAEAQFNSGIPVSPPPEIAKDTYGLIAREDLESFVEEDLLYTSHLFLRQNVDVKQAVKHLTVFLTGFFATLIVAAAVTHWSGAVAYESVGDQAVAPVVGCALGGLLMVLYMVRGHLTADVFDAQPLPTHVARMHLWRAWRLRREGRRKIEAVHAMALDEILLRQSDSLRRYWTARDRAAVPEALVALHQNHDAIKADMFIRDDKQFRSHLVMRVSDLAVCAAGGDSPLLMDQDELARLSKLDLAKIFQVVGLDSGTWPMDGGGVASCRRDLVDRLEVIRWRMMAEIGHDIRSVMDAYQIEQHVLSVQYIPLWGTNFGSPAQSILAAKPFVTMELMAQHTTVHDVRTYFLPLLRQLVAGCSTSEPSLNHVEGSITMFVNLHHYFQHYGWVETWSHPLVRYTWIREWGSKLAAAEAARAGLLPVEHPTLQDLDDTLEFFLHFLLPLSVPLPSNVPVYHASHHGIQALLGVIAKRVHGSSLVIWDHGILWRERLMGYCQFQGAQPFVRNSLVGLQRLVAFVTMQAADVMVPCTNIANPGWEAWLGGVRGDSGCASLMWSKISPVVNGMETDKFQVHREQEDQQPTVVMLSHVTPLKDIITAIEAAAVVVNDYKCTKYQLYIYGAIDKEPDYVAQCMALITSNGLGSNVFLMGLGAAPKVLPRGWIFLNSSKTEGLPLALGEAGLAGLPVVCTDVGGSRELLLDGPFTYGRVVPPGRPALLARGQLEVLTMTDGLQEMVEATDEWRQRGGPPPGVAPLEQFAGPPGQRTPDVLLQRMQDMKKCRQQLGMLFRARVLRDFSMERYLREHEQVIRIANQVSRMRRGLAVYGAELTAEYQNPVDLAAVDGRSADDDVHAWSRTLTMQQTMDGSMFHAPLVRSLSSHRMLPGSMESPSRTPSSGGLGSRGQLLRMPTTAPSSENIRGPSSVPQSGLISLGSKLNLTASLRRLGSRGLLRGVTTSPEEEERGLLDSDTAGAAPALFPQRSSRMLTRVHSSYSDASVLHQTLSMPRMVVPTRTRSRARLMGVLADSMVPGQGVLGRQQSSSSEPDIDPFWAMQAVLDGETAVPQRSSNSNNRFALDSSLF